MEIKIKEHEPYKMVRNSQL